MTMRDEAALGPSYARLKPQQAQKNGCFGKVQVITWMKHQAEGWRCQMSYESLVAR